MAAVSIATALVAYLLGSIPTGYLAGRARGIDLRTTGSGNIGATNALRVLGRRIGGLVLAIDMLKGLLAATVVPQAFFRWLAAPAAGAAMPVWLPILGGIAGVLGHNFTCWLRFRGGKGVATSAGVLLGILPLPFVTVLGVFLLVLAVTRIVSLSSLVAAAALPVATLVWNPDPVLIGFSIALAALAFVRHRANIRRLLAGTEPRIGAPGPDLTPRA